MATLNIVDFIKIFYRSFFIQATWNYERRQGLGYCFCLIPFAKKYLINKSDRVEFLERNLEFFNSHPYMANWIIGAALKMEQQSLQKREVESAQIDQFKTHMSVVAAAIGDQMFWSQIKPLSA
ncbi:MAG: PTS system mannose/fructose/sorbose family transporter subunit IID, partial [bacterium]